MRHKAGIKYICKLDCSQANHCLQIANEQSIQLLSFKFDARILAYRCLAQGWNRSPSAFNSFVREYPDPVVKAHRCAPYVDDIGTHCGQTSPKHWISVSADRTCRSSLSIIKCTCQRDKMEFFGRTDSKQSVARLLKKIERFLTNLKLPTSVKSL